MPAATTSGSDAKPNGSAKSREHNQGNQDRKYTPEQKAEVLRVRRCQPTAFYEILNLESVKTTVTDTEIKKAYRKISLLTHPDKNGHEHADEVFKMVSRAFGVLGDPEKRSKFDRFGGDPDSRFGGGAPPQSSPFSGFANRGAGQRAPSGQAGGNMWDGDISPEEMFNRFFGGGGGGFGGFGGGGGGMFDAGPQFVFNMGGGPGVRVHQFGGNRPRRRPRDPNAPPEPPASLQTTLMGFLPIIFLLLLPIISSIFGGDSSPAPLPSYRFENPVPPLTLHRQTPRYKVDYYLKPTDVEAYSTSQWNRLDKTVEVNFIHGLSRDCQAETAHQSNMYNQAQGWFSTDAELVHAARNLPLKACRTLDAMGLSRDQY